MTSEQVFEALGIESHNSGVFAGEWLDATGDTIDVINPTTGESLASVTLASVEDYEEVVATSVEAFQRWRHLPAPKRGDYIRRLGNAF
jgi:aldehyde dehydrogenase (NAD+)